MLEETAPSCAQVMNFERNQISLATSASMQRSKTINLGPIISTYRGRPLRWRDIFLIFLPGTLAVFAPLAYGVWRTNYGYAQYGPIAASAWGRPWFLIAAFSTLCLLVLALIRMHTSSIRVDVHRNGLSIRLSPFKHHKLHWTQISGIATSTIKNHFLGMVLKKTRSVTLYPTLGSPIGINDRVKNISALADQIKSKIYTRLLPALHANLSKGRSLHFGQLSINQQHITLKSKKFRWEEVTNITVQSGYLVLHLAKKRRLRLATTYIPNIEILFQLINQGIKL